MYIRISCIYNVFHESAYFSTYSGVSTFFEHPVQIYINTNDDSDIIGQVQSYNGFVIYAI